MGVIALSLSSSTRQMLQRSGHLLLLNAIATPPVSLINQKNRHFSFAKTTYSFSKALIPNQQQQQQASRSFASARSSLEPPDLSRLAETARISLTQHEIEEFTPKIQQMVDWFGQLQAVDLQSIEPAIRADTEGSNWRDDVPEIFENREAIIAAVPDYEEPFIKVPKVLNKE